MPPVYNTTITYWISCYKLYMPLTVDNQNYVSIYFSRYVNKIH
jgi:hypothetical protein